MNVFCIQKYAVSFTDFVLLSYKLYDEISNLIYCKHFLDF